MRVYYNFIENNERETLKIYAVIDNNFIEDIYIEPNDFLDLEIVQQVDFEKHIKIFANCKNCKPTELIATITKENIIL